MKPAAVGFRARSGWATAIVLSGSQQAPVLLLRRHLILADPKMHGSEQPYHSIEKFALGEAERRLGRYKESSGRLARAELARIVEEVREKGFVVARSGVLAGSGRALPGLEKILAAHVAIHAAEGVFFREALRAVSVGFGLPVLEIIEKEAWAQAGADLQRCITGMGKQVGPPWRMDEKLAALAAWHCLAV